MAVVPCAPPYHSDSDQNQSFSNHLHSESFSSLASFPSSSSSLLLDHQPSTTHYHSISTLKGHSSYVFSLTLAGKRLYSGSYDNQIRAWSRDPVTGHNRLYGGDVVAAGDHGAVKSLVVSGDRLFAAQQDGRIRVWKIVDGEAHDPQHRKYHQIATLPTLNDRFSKLFLPKNYVQVRRHKKATWVHHVDAVSALALSRDGTLLYSASWDRSFKVWDTSNFKCLESVARAHDDAINALVVSGDGYVYTGSADMTIKVWKKQQGKNKKVKKKKHSLVVTLEKHKSAVNALALSSDGQVLYSGACDRSILVWEKDDSDSDGEHMTTAGTLIGHTKAILCLTVVSDLLVSGSADNTVRIWRKRLNRSYACFAVLQGHTRPVKCLSAAMDGSYDGGNEAGPGTYCLVYSGSLDHNIRAWKVWVPLLR